ncbi:CD1375 family protein [Brevibacillus nitrificans]
MALTSPADNLSLGRRTIDSVPVNLRGEVQEMLNADSA